MTSDGQSLHLQLKRDELERAWQVVEPARPRGDLTMIVFEDHAILEVNEPAARIRSRISFHDPKSSSQNTSIRMDFNSDLFSKLVCNRKLNPRSYKRGEIDNNLLNVCIDDVDKLETEGGALSAKLVIDDGDRLIWPCTIQAIKGAQRPFMKPGVEMPRAEFADALKAALSLKVAREDTRSIVWFEKTQILAFSTLGVVSVSDAPEFPTVAAISMQSAHVLQKALTSAGGECCVDEMGQSVSFRFENPNSEIEVPASKRPMAEMKIDEDGLWRVVLKLSSLPVRISGLLAQAFKPTSEAKMTVKTPESLEFSVAVAGGYSTLTVPIQEIGSDIKIGQANVVELEPFRKVMEACIQSENEDVIQFVLREKFVDVVSQSGKLALRFRIRGRWQTPTAKTGLDSGLGF